MVLASLPAHAAPIPIGTLDWFQSPNPCDPAVDPFCPSHVFTVVNNSADATIAADLGLPAGGSLLFTSVEFLVDGAAQPSVPFDVGDLFTSGQTLFDGAVAELTIAFSILPIVASVPTGTPLLGALSVPTLTGPGSGILTFTPAAALPVPEPATWLLLGVGAALVVRRRHARRGDRRRETSAQ
jgi:hypothetical protein